MKRLLIIPLFLLLAFGYRPMLAVAQTSASDPATSLVIPCDTTVTDEDGNVTIANPCTIEDFLNQFVKLSQYGMSGVLVLGMLMMVYGGVQFVTAGGRASKVDEGKRVMLGTITGIMISLAAYVIINFSISAITGTSRPVTDYVSGPIAILFGGKPEERPFSGTNNGQNGVDNRTGCRASSSTWDKTCGNQIYCADPGTKDGPVVALQKKLNAKNCDCGGNDGCFGSATFSCVRRFQIANQLPPTGLVDGNTERLIDSTSGSKNCNDPSVTSLVSGVEAQLPPAPSNNPVLSASPSTKGCCIVAKTAGSTTQPLFCADAVTERTCLSQGAGSIFLNGSMFCSALEQARSSCGFCYDQSGSCFQQASPYWCSNIVQPGGAMSFSQDRTCLNSHPLCGAGCSNGLFVTQP